MRVKKGDMVVVVAGDDKGKTGEVIRVYPDESRVLVKGINEVFRHLRPSRKNPKGGRMKKEMPVHISNVMPIDPETSQPTRVRFAVNADGSKERLAVKSGKSLGVVRKAR
ncbi:MAG TPA: 50S ribosomal protein L24 [Phycisphaerae bacterium]|nr:50S ribosomal protein L24 [Phycisphaerae bacterium]HPS53137.1 50S ribosomal protein L24 [Phycisphaerae bacterium]